MQYWFYNMSVMHPKVLSDPTLRERYGIKLPKIHVIFLLGFYLALLQLGLFGVVLMLQIQMLDRN